MQKNILIGRTTREIDFKILGDGTCVSNFDLAVNRKFGNSVDYIPCVAWNDNAKEMNDNLGKGSEILVQGEIRSRPKRRGDYKGKDIQFEIEEYKILDAKAVQSKKEEVV